MLSCWSCNALPSVPAAFSIAVYQTMKSSFVWPWMYSVLKSLKIFWMQERKKNLMLFYNSTEVVQRNTRNKTSRHLPPHRIVMVAYCYSTFFPNSICTSSVTINHRGSTRRPVTDLWKDLNNILITLQSSSCNLHSYVQVTVKKETKDLQTTFKTRKDFFCFPPPFSIG